MWSNHPSPANGLALLLLLFRWFSSEAFTAKTFFPSRIQSSLSAMSEEAFDAMSQTFASSPSINADSSFWTSLAFDTTNLKPAAGHSQPFWGSPDRYLTAGKSIAPPLLPRPSLTEYPENAQAAALKGWKILDSSSITQESLLPGFQPTGGILSPSHIAPETPFSFLAQTEYAVWFLPIYQKLPYAVLAYALLEFFILRPGIDIYLEERDENLVETVITSGVRLGALGLIGGATLFFYG